MLELYSSAIDKIRRIDVLKDELRALKGEDGKLSSSITVYRKKNDWREKDGNDGAISRINDRRAAVSKREALAKAEIKSLRAEVYDLLSVCFAGAKTEEHRAKIREACLYASGGAAMISQTGNVPSAFGKCKIVGCRATRDITLDGTVEKIVRAGVKNTSGRFIVLPEVVVYRFDENSAEGEYSVLNERYPEDSKPREFKPVVDYVDEVEPSTEDIYPAPTEILRETSEPLPKEEKPPKVIGGGKFGGKKSLVALLIAAVWVGFYISAALLKVAAGEFGNEIWKYAVSYLAFSLVRTFAVLVSHENRSDGDLFALFSFYGGALSAFALIWSASPEKSFALPLAMLLSGIISLTVNPAGGEKTKNSELSVASYVAAGVVLALAVYNIYISAGIADDKAQKIFAFVAFCFVEGAGVGALIAAYLKKGGKNIAYSLFGFSAFSAVAALCYENAIGIIALSVLFAVSGIVRINKAE